MSNGAIECYPQCRRKLDQDNGSRERSYVYFRVRQLCVRRVCVRSRSGGVGACVTYAIHLDASVHDPIRFAPDEGFNTSLIT